MPTLKVIAIVLAIVIMVLFLLGNFDSALG